MTFEDLMAHVQSATYNVTQASDLLSRLLALEQQRPSNDNGNLSSQSASPRSSISTGTGSSAMTKAASFGCAQNVAGDKMVEAAIAVREASRRQSVMSTSSSSQGSASRNGHAVGRDSLHLPSDGGAELGRTEDQRTPTIWDGRGKNAGPIVERGNINELESYPFSFVHSTDVEERRLSDASLRYQASADNLLIDLEQRYLSAKGHYEALQETLGVIHASLSEAIASARRFARQARAEDERASVRLNDKQCERLDAWFKEHLAIQRSYLDEAAELVQYCRRARISTEPIRSELAKLRGGYSELFEVLQSCGASPERTETIAAAMDQACDALAARLCSVDADGGLVEMKEEEKEEARGNQRLVGEVT